MSSNSSGIKRARSSRISLFLHFQASAGHSRKLPKAAKSLTYDQLFRDKSRFLMQKISQKPTVEAIISVKRGNKWTEVCLMSRIPGADKSDKSCISKDWKRLFFFFYHEWVVAKIALAQSKGPHLQLDEVGVFDSGGMWELCMRNSGCQGVNRVSVMPVLTKKKRATASNFRILTRSEYRRTCLSVQYACLDLPLPVTYKLPKKVPYYRWTAQPIGPSPLSRSDFPEGFVYI